MADTGVAYGGRAGGALYLYRDAAGLAEAAAKAQILRDEGVEVRAVTPDEAAAIDPVYEPVRDRFAGALYAPGDESGDARLFTRGLADWLAARGVEFRLGETVDPHRTPAATASPPSHTDRGELAADAYVLALGCWSAAVRARARARPAGLPDQGLFGHPADRGPQQSAAPSRASTRTICSPSPTTAIGCA